MTERRVVNGVVFDFPDGTAPMMNGAEQRPPVPDPVNDAELIAHLARETRELRAELAAARAKIDDAVRPEKPIVLRHISDIVAEKREPQWLIHKIIERFVLAVIAGARGTFKSFIAIDWAMRMALGGHPGVILSGEGAGLDRRIAAWLNQHRENADIAEIPLYALERQLNLTAVLEMHALCEAIRALHPALEFIVIDTLSKFATGLDENDNGEMAAFLSALSIHLREELSCTVILVAHSGHGDSARPRGASSLMSNPDAEYIVSRPDPLGMTVTVSRERFKDSPALPPLAYEAKVIDLGRVDQYGGPVTSLALVTTDAPAPTVKGFGKNQEKLLVALKEWQRAHPDSTHITSIDIREICKAQKVNRKREREVLNTFVNARILSPSVGGYALHGENL
jgi:KaiC/GvpD/RAD55 family RecA-like ATPase